MRVTTGYLRALITLLRSERPSYNAERYATPSAVEHYAQAPALKQVERQVVERHLKGIDEVLEVGCGAGRVSAILSGLGFRMTSLDISETLVREGVRRGYLARANPLVADAARLPFRSERFGAVWFTYNGIDLMYPKEARRAFLREAHRVLRPGGVLIYSSHTRRPFLRPRTRLSVLVLGVNVVRPAFWREGYILVPSRAEGALLMRCEDIDEAIERTEREGFRCATIESKLVKITPGSPRAALRQASAEDATPTYVFARR